MNRIKFEPEAIERVAQELFQAEYARDFRWEELTEAARQEWRKRAEEELKKKRRNGMRKARDQAMRDLGLTKVRGDLGGIYWE